MLHYRYMGPNLLTTLDTIAYTKGAMRYESVTKTQRNQELIAYVLKHPEKGYAEVGKRYGISKARVSAILRRYGIRYRKEGEDGQPS